MISTTLETRPEVEAQAHRVTAKEYIREAGQDPSAHTRDALMTFGKLAARLARAEGWEERKKEEEGFNVHTWPRAVWDAVVGGQRADVPPATPRQIGYVMLLACACGMQSRAMERLSFPLDMDQAGEMIDRLKGKIAERNMRSQRGGFSANPYE